SLTDRWPPSVTRSLSGISSIAIYLIVASTRSFCKFEIPPPRSWKARRWPTSSDRMPQRARAENRGRKSQKPAYFRWWCTVPRARNEEDLCFCSRPVHADSRLFGLRIRTAEHPRRSVSQHHARTSHGRQGAGNVRKSHGAGKDRLEDVQCRT